ncbi:hypothetical protein HYU11_04715 [Candidatus Woesearchaeota archaeon]|nr:hypothetical protein [Candidatus Woesearchaeota archaeon]
MRRLLILLAFILALSTLPTQADTAITSQWPPNEATIDSAEIQFLYTPSSISNISSCTLKVNSTSDITAIQPASNGMSSFEKSLPEGSYFWNISCTDQSSANTTKNSRLTIDTTIPTLTITGPKNKVRTSNSTATFTFIPADSNLKSCSLHTNHTGTYSTTQPASGIESSITATLPDGSYTWSIRCNDSIHSTSSTSYVLTIDITPPLVQSQTPSVSGKTSLNLNITTNENATCRYSESDIEYGSMSQMAVTGTTEHSIFLTGMSEGTHSYYIRCSDHISNTMSLSYTARLSIQLPPTAEIMLSDPSPLKPGVLEITVLTSKQMLTTPQLSYSYNDAPNSAKPIPLSPAGSPTLWKGYIIADDTGAKRIGNFFFSGTDTSGITGTEITAGKYFIVDPVKPTSPISVKTSVDTEGQVKLTWYYDDADVEYYTVFRASSAGVDYTDEYATTNETSFKDTSTSEKTTYYYKVNVVDKAGNKGPLSQEVYATSIKQEAVAESKTESPKSLPPNLVPKVDEAIAEAEDRLMEAKAQLAGLRSKTSASEREIILKLALIQKAESATSQIDQILANLGKTKETYATESEVQGQLDRARQELGLIMKTAPADIEILDSSTSLQTATKDDISRAVNAALESLSEEEKKEYIERAYTDGQAIKIEAIIISAKIEYADGSTAYKTLITKSFSHQSPEILQDLIIIETIPKTVAQDISDIELLTQDYEIVNKDPIIKWGFLELGYDEKKIDYVINSQVETAQAKDAKSIPLPNINKLKNPEQITGLSIFEAIGSRVSDLKSGTIFIILSTSAIAILLVYYLGFAKVPEPAFRNRVELGEGMASYIIMKNMINDANNYIYAGRQGEARILYQQIQKMYSGLDPKVRAHIYNDCMEIQKQIEDDRGGRRQYGYGKVY